MPSTTPAAPAAPAAPVPIPSLPEAQFSTEKEAFEYARGHARDNGYALSLKHSKLARQQFHLCCDRGSYQDALKPVGYVKPEDRKRQRGTAQTECPYSVYIRHRMKEGNWLVSEVGKEHNHERSSGPSVHAQHRRFTSDERELIAELATGEAKLKPLQILRMLKKRDPSNLAVIEDVYNAVAVAKKKKLNGATYIEAAVEKLHQLDWAYQFKTDRDGSLTDIVYALREGLQLLQQFPTVIFVDCTYKTNKVRNNTSCDPHFVPILVRCCVC
jgi:hypothetical protein